MGKISVEFCACCATQAFVMCVATLPASPASGLFLALVLANKIFIHRVQRSLESLLGHHCVLQLTAYGTWVQGVRCEAQPPGCWPLAYTGSSLCPGIARESQVDSVMWDSVQPRMNHSLQDHNPVNVYR